MLRTSGDDDIVAGIAGKSHPFAGGTHRGLDDLADTLRSSGHTWLSESSFVHGFSAAFDAATTDLIAR